MEESYCYDKSTPNPYHNSIHAADVLQTTAHFCTTGSVQKRLRVIHGFALFVAALGHDYRHPGKTNAFLIHTQDDIAITYNDMSVLESFHAAELFKALLRPNMNILGGMDQVSWSWSCWEQWFVWRYRRYSTTLTLVSPFTPNKRSCPGA